jgi:hypothetical protein
VHAVVHAGGGMKIRIASERLASFLALGWVCTLVDEGMCTVENHDFAPLFPCQECESPMGFAQFVRYGGDCDACFGAVVLH